MTVNLSNMSIDQLQDLIKDAESTIRKKQREQRSEVIQQMRQLASTIGVSVEITTTGPKKKKTKSAPKYRNPKNSSQTWTGRGPQPKWFKDAIAAGKKSDDMLIK